MVRSLVNIKDHAAVWDGVAIDTIPVWNAVAAIPSTGGTVGLPVGKGKLNDTVTFNTTGSHLLGAGKRAAMIYFNPTSAKALWVFSAGASTLSLCSIRHMTLYGQGDFQKIGIQLLDVSDFVVDDIELKNWIGNGSIGIQAKGRDAGTFNKLTVYADRPISIEENPNAPIYAADHFYFRDLYLVTQEAAESGIVIEPDMAVNNLTIDGASLCLGRHGLYWNDVGNPSYVCMCLHLTNIRREQSEDVTGYTAYVNHPVYVAQLENIKCDITARGFYFRKVKTITVQNCWYDGTGEAFNADSSCENIVFINFRRNPLSTMSMTGLTQVVCLPPPPATPVFEIWQPS
jgi:hypothetical protein